jgi:hypothetical protein
MAVKTWWSTAAAWLALVLAAASTPATAEGQARRHCRVVFK